VSYPSPLFLLFEFVLLTRAIRTALSSISRCKDSFSLHVCEIRVCPSSLIKGTSLIGSGFFTYLIIYSPIVAILISSTYKLPLSNLNTLLVLGPLNELFLVLMYSSWVTGLTSTILPLIHLFSDVRDTYSYTIYIQPSGRVNIVCVNLLSVKTSLLVFLSESVYFFVLTR